MAYLLSKTGISWVNSGNGVVSIFAATTPNPYAPAGVIQHPKHEPEVAAALLRRRLAEMDSRGAD